MSSQTSISNPNCRVCRNQKVREDVEELFSLGKTYEEIVSFLEKYNRQFTVSELKFHEDYCMNPPQAMTIVFKKFSESYRFHNPVKEMSDLIGTIRKDINWVRREMKQSDEKKELLKILNDMYKTLSTALRNYQSMIDDVTKGRSQNVTVAQDLKSILKKVKEKRQNARDS